MNWKSFRLLPYSGNFLLSGSADSTVKVIDCVANEYRILLQNCNFAWKVWDVQEGHLFYTLRGHTGSVNCVAFAPLGDFFCSSGDDTNLMVIVFAFEFFYTCIIKWFGSAGLEDKLWYKARKPASRSAPSPSRTLNDGSLNNHRKGTASVPTRVSNSPGIHASRCTLCLCVKICNLLIHIAVARHSMLLLIKANMNMMFEQSLILFGGSWFE